MRKEDETTNEETQAMPKCLLSWNIDGKKTHFWLENATVRLAPSGDAEIDLDAIPTLEQILSVVGALNESSPLEAIRKESLAWLDEHGFVPPQPKAQEPEAPTVDVALAAQITSFVEETVPKLFEPDLAALAAMAAQAQADLQRLASQAPAPVEPSADVEEYRVELAEIHAFLTDTDRLQKQPEPEPAAVDIGEEVALEVDAAAVQPEPAAEVADPAAIYRRAMERQRLASEVQIEVAPDEKLDPAPR